MKQIKKHIAIKSLAPILMVKDVAATMRFYEEVLDFKQVVTVPEQSPFVFGLVNNGAVELQFQEAKSFTKDIAASKARKIGGTVALYMDVSDINLAYKRAAKRCKIVKKPHKTFYGTKEFYMLDCNGYIIGFAEKQ